MYCLTYYRLISVNTTVNLYCVNYMNTTNSLLKAKQRIKELKESGEYVAYTNPIAKLKVKNTISQAVKAKCAECVGCTIDYIETGFKTTISNCSSLTCPLHSFRPYKDYKKTLNVNDLES